MKHFLTILVVSAFLMQPAAAADIFVRKGPPPAPKIEEPQPVEPAPVPAAEPVAKQPVASVAEYANQYYSECVEKSDAVLSGPNLELQCACTSQKIVEQMRLEDVNSMITETSEGEFQRNRLLLQAYAPCMGAPARAILSAKCEGDKNIQKTVKSFQQACGCMGNAMALYVAENGASIIAKSLRSQVPGDKTTPVSHMMRDPEFQARTQSALAECVKNAVPPPQPLAPGGNDVQYQQVPQSPLSPPVMGQPQPQQ
jgi:hypothetical protein